MRARSWGRSGSRPEPPGRGVARRPRAPTRPEPRPARTRRCHCPSRCRVARAAGGSPPPPRSATTIIRCLCRDRRVSPRAGGGRRRASGRAARAAARLDVHVDPGSAGRRAASSARRSSRRRRSRSRSSGCVVSVALAGSHVPAAHGPVEAHRRPWVSMKGPSPSATVLLRPARAASSARWSRRTRSSSCQPSWPEDALSWRGLVGARRESGRRGRRGRWAAGRGWSRATQPLGTRPTRTGRGRGRGRRAPRAPRRRRWRPRPRCRRGRPTGGREVRRGRMRARGRFGVARRLRASESGLPARLRLVADSEPAAVVGVVRPDPSRLERIGRSGRAARPRHARSRPGAVESSPRTGRSAISRSWALGRPPRRVHAAATPSDRRRIAADVVGLRAIVSAAL